MSIPTNYSPPIRGGFVHLERPQKSESADVTSTGCKTKNILKARGIHKQRLCVCVFFLWNDLVNYFFKKKTFRFRIVQRNGTTS